MFKITAPRILVVLAASCAPALAQVPEGDAAAGQKLVEERCSACHAVEPGKRATQEAPPLEAVARMPSTTSLSLHAFLLTPHPTMPNFRLTPREVDDVVAYILSLRSY
jgi:mono/diheme cytochrome c family protein